MKGTVVKAGSTNTNPLRLATLGRLRTSEEVNLGILKRRRGSGLYSGPERGMWNIDSTALFFNDLFSY